MFFLGILSAFQIAFLPGFLLLKAFDLKRGFIQTLVFSFGMSLITNYAIVLLLTSLRVNLPIMHYMILTSEVLILIKLYYKDFVQSTGNIVDSILSAASQRFASLKSIRDRDPHQTVVNIIMALVTGLFVILALSSIWWMFRVWLNNLGTVFSLWDAVVSWNKWAMDWFANTIPPMTRRYPQLIPANFSVTYSFMNSSKIQFFAKGIMPLFTLYTLLLMLDLGLEHQSAGYFVGIVITRYIMKKFMGNYLGEGYVDVALAFFTFLTVFTLIKANASTSEKRRLHYVYLGAIFAAGAAVTKQNGLFVFVCYPVLAYALVVKEMTGLSCKSMMRHIFGAILLGLVIILPWYLFNEYRIYIAINEDNVSYLIGARHEGRNLVERFIRAAQLLEKYAILYPFLLVAIFIVDAAYRWVALTIVFPYSLIWAFAFSTFPRNLALVFPLLGLITGMGVERMMELGAGFLKRLKVGNIKLYVVVILLIGSITIPTLAISDSAMNDQQVAQQKRILFGNINRRIYEYFDKTGSVEPIITNYPIRFLPGMEDMQIQGTFNDYEYYKWKREQHPDVRLILVQNKQADHRVMEEIQQNIEAGNYELIFEESGYLLVKIRYEP